MTAAFQHAPDSATYPVNGPMLRLVLRILGWSQAEFGRRLGVSEATASRVLNGRAPITAANARKLLDLVPRLRIEEVVALPGISPTPPDGARDLLYLGSGTSEFLDLPDDGRGTQVSDGRPA